MWWIFHFGMQKGPCPSFWEIFINWRARGAWLFKKNTQHTLRGPPYLIWVLLLLLPRDQKWLTVWRCDLRHPALSDLVNSHLLPHHSCSQLHVASTHGCSAAFKPPWLHLCPPSLVSSLAPLFKSHRGCTHPSQPSHWLQLPHLLMFNSFFCQKYALFDTNMLSAS